MKKALVVCSLALLSFIPASAQFSWGLRGGLNLVNNDITSVSKETALDKDSYTGFFFGPMAELQIPIIGIGIDGSLLYSQKGMNLPNDSVMKNQSISIPVSLKYSLGLGNFASVFVAAGPQFDYKLGDLSTMIKTYKANGDFDEAKEYVMNQYSWSVNIGAGVKLINHLQAAVNYNIPLSQEGTFNLYNDVQNGKYIKAAGQADKAFKASTLQFLVTWTF
ncbi:MAG: PorT family protein [Bacteroidaceae bacterium]|nr:PorT family protein [Bacteroidaceae bacterium]